MTAFLGVDGGGSKTAFVLLDGHGSVLAESTGPSCYYFDAGIDLVEGVLSDGLGAVLSEAGLSGSDVDFAFFGLPGYGEASADLAVLDAIPGNILGHGRYECDNDMVCAWAGSLGGEDGINVISGTGSMTYGRRDGIGCRVGGWGELFGDEGSAHWIAVRGLNAFSRMSDGRLESGPLADILRTRLDLRDDIDVVSLLLDAERGQRARVADLSRSVGDAAVAGDREALAILYAAGEELASLVVATRERLGYAAEEIVPVSFSGGVFSNDLVSDAFSTALSRGPAYDLREPLFSPVRGAALYAAQLAGTPIASTTESPLPQPLGRVTHSVSSS